MIRYSWKKIQLKAGKSALRIIMCIRSMIEKRTPHNYYDPLFKYKEKDFSGESYLLNPSGVINSDATNKEVADYIGLASFRKYSDYLVTNDASLDILHSPLSEEQIKQNRLLSIENGRIKFKYEEVTRRK